MGKLPRIETGMTRRLVSRILLVSLAVLVVAIGVRAWERASFLRSSSDEAKSNSAVRISASCSVAVWQYDVQTLDNILRSQLLDPSLVSIRIYQGQSETLEWLTRLPSGVIESVVQAPVGNFDTRTFPIRYPSASEDVSLQATISLWFDDSLEMAVLVNDLAWNIGIVVFIVLTLTLTLSLTFLRRLVHPLELIRSGMIEAANSSSQGVETVQIAGTLPRSAFPELGRMAKDLDGVFAQITSAIAQQRVSEAKVLNVNDNLELQVQKRTEELADTNHELSEALESLRRVQDELVKSAQLAVLGRLVASIAHEINTPLGAIVSSNASITQGISSLRTGLLPFFATLGDAERTFLQDLLESAQHRTFPLDSPADRKWRRAYVQFFEKQGNEDAVNLADVLVETGYRMNEAALETLVRFPNYQRIVDEGGTVASLLLASRIVQLATEKMMKFVSALKTYSRNDNTGDVFDVDLLESLETVLVLFQHEIKLGVTVEREFQTVPMARCRHDGVQQVWTNLISNALHAMDHRGTLTLRARRSDQWVVVDIQDTGTGIPPGVQHRVFTPFFTTKKPGEGTGLGLDIARRIVLESGGRIEFESTPGCTVFHVWLPVAPMLP